MKMMDDMNPGQVDVQVCTGTACFLMGAGELLEAANALPEALRARISLTGAHCLDLCRSGRYASAPFALVDGEVVSGADAESFTSAILAALHKREDV